jgi:hypothetical protein
VEPLLDGGRGLAVAMCGRRAGQSRGALEVVADGRDRGEAEESLEADGRDHELAAEPQLGAERLTSSVGVPGDQLGEPGVAVQHH